MIKLSVNLRVMLMAIILIMGISTSAAQGKPTHSLKLHITERTNNQPIIMATIHIEPSGAMAVTNMNGDAIVHNIPEGLYQINISYVGFETITTQINVNKDLDLKFAMTETSLSLREVNVTAKRKVSGASTSSIIERQAIDHLQASSLADLMQLIPGQLMGNVSLTSPKNLQLRTLVNNNTSAFGSSIIVDGMPMSNNGALTQGQFSSTSFTGTDLRQIAADNIDNVEIIRGIPSAEYGDLTSGLVVVHSKVGITPWLLKAKITPEIQNYSISKGFKLSNKGILNISGDYAKAWGDPRQKTQSFNRYSLNVGYGKDFSSIWHTDTKLRLMIGKDWNGKDPDAIKDGTEQKNITTTVGITHNGKLSIDKPLIRTLAYTLGFTMSSIDNKTSSYVATSTGLLPIITATQTGYWQVPWRTTSYLATGKTESRPANLFAKFSNSFFYRKGKTVQSFKMGAEYRADWNHGKGYYNVDDSLPLRPNSNGRPRAFSDIPVLHQFSIYAEDNFSWNINNINRLHLQLGARFTTQQPFTSLSTNALSPRFNASLSLTKWLSIRSGIGLNSKTPGLNYLYPDKKYDDRVALNYMPQDGLSQQMLVYHTQVYDVKRSTNLKNATTTKIEIGIDIKLPGNRTFNLLAYRDKTPNGFGPATDFLTYPLIIYETSMNNPIRNERVYMTKGNIGNTNTTVNKGIEFDFNLGEIKPLHTTLLLSGAWQETKTWSTDLYTTAVPSVQLPASYSAYGYTPFRVVYPSAIDYSRYRRFINTLRIVTNIPALKMVASFTGQVIWHNSIWSYNGDKNPIGIITPDLAYHPISIAMQDGYLDMDGKYYTQQPDGEKLISIKNMQVHPSDNKPNKSPIEWNLSARLTKELGRIGGLSLYANNMLFYEPFMVGNNSSSLIQRNVGTFSFGAELYINL